MTLVNEMAEFLDPQMVLELIKFDETHGSQDSKLKTLKLQALEATLRADEYSAAGGDSTKAAEMREEANNAKDANSLYAAGRYEDALEALKSNGNVWGGYAANVMSGNYTAAAAILPQIHDQVEQLTSGATSTVDGLNQLNQRAWFVHWTLFSLFRIDGGREKVVELFFQTQCMTTVQAVCPWVLRYLAVAVILTLPGRYPLQNKRFKDLTRAIVQESYEYTDAVLDFIAGLTVRYENIATLGSKLAKAHEVLSKDYFCSSFADAFVKSCRALAVGSYTKTHNSINVETIANGLQITKDEVLELLKNENITATSANIYLVSHIKPSLDQSLSDKIKNINQRAAASLSQAQSKHENAMK